MAETEKQTELSAAVRRLIEPWNQACMGRDWDALLSMCTEDIVFMPPGSPAVSGAAIRPWLDSFPNVTAMSWDVEDLDSNGDLAFARGPVRQTFEIDGDVVELDGKYCDVLRRSSDGNWRFALIIWNPNQA